MADTRTPEQRRRIMQSVKTRDTGPELIVRRLLHNHGYRYRLNAKHLPGSPDIVFSAQKKAIFVHGCFWHSHNCEKGKPPKSGEDYWRLKLKANTDRDIAKREQLEALGWSVLTVWQCETRDAAALFAALSAFLETGAKPVVLSSGA